MEDMRNEYRKAEAYLTINGASVVKAELEKVNRENMELKLKYLELYALIQLPNRKVRERTLERHRKLQPSLPRPNLS